GAERLDLITRYASAGNLRYYSASEGILVHRGLGGTGGHAGVRDQQAPTACGAHGLRGVHRPSGGYRHTRRDTYRDGGRFVRQSLDTQRLP
ncbi:MAG TPA: hypothetical protein VFO16_03935, partial [Pseudonocardiaceae bacterium]|nr:hypothetical protein [Pseudonocardiaceae bacterium]